MILRNKLFIVFLLHLLPWAIEAQVRTLHVVTFIATEDRLIGDHLKQTEAMVNDWVIDLKENLTSHPEVRVVQYNYGGNRFQYEELVNFVNGFQPQYNDATIFWFVGLGYEDDSRNTPNVVLTPYQTRNHEDLLNNSINLQSIYDALSNRTDFFWMIGDACNSPLYDGETTASPQGGNEFDYVSPREDLPIEGLYTRYNNYYDLFFQTRQQHLFFDIRKGRPTYSSKAKGAIYSYAFLTAVYEYLESKDLINTEMLSRGVLSKYESLLTEVAEVMGKYSSSVVVDNPGFFKRIISTLFEGASNRKLRRTYKKTLESGNLEDIGGLIPLANSSYEESENYLNFIKEKPTMYYTTLGLFEEYTSETTQDSAYVGECFCTAYELSKQGISTDKEFVSLLKLQKYNASSGDPLGIEKAGGRLQWLQLKCEEYKKFFKTKKQSQEYRIEQIRKTRLIEEDSLLQLISKKFAAQEDMMAIQDQVNANQEVIQQTTIEWANEDYDLTYTIEKIPKNKAEQECLKRTVDKLKEGLPLVDDCEKLFAQYVKITKGAQSKNAIKAHGNVQTMGATLGQYCDNSIEEATALWLQPLLATIQDLPQSPIDYRGRLKIALQITGYADAVPCRGSGCRFVGLETSTYRYTDAEGKPKSFSTLEGQTQRISNEELALARALCAQKMVQRQLNELGLTDVKYELVAVVKEDQQATSRGVSLAFVLENQYLHHRDEIEKYSDSIIALQSRLDLQSQKLKELERQIDKAEQELLEITQKIQQTKEHLFQIEQEILALEKSNISQNLIEILLARGYTRKEAEAFLKE